MDFDSDPVDMNPGERALAFSARKLKSALEFEPAHLFILLPFGIEFSELQFAPLTRPMARLASLEPTTRTRVAFDSRATAIGMETRTGIQMEIGCCVRDLLLPIGPDSLSREGVVARPPSRPPARGRSRDQEARGELGSEIAMRGPFVDCALAFGANTMSRFEQTRAPSSLSSRRANERSAP